jgi:hypothetical protein
MEMFTFVTTVKNKDERGNLKLVAVIETRALTKEQAEKQALARDFVVHDAFGQVIESPNLIWLTVRKFAIEVERK